MLTLVTAPLEKKKQYLHDAFGRLLRVEEQNAGGTLVETARYTYDYMGRLTKVQMGKINETTFKQTRTFVYNTKGQLTSATNSENGTVTYTYLANGLMQSKTDAKNQTLWFNYDGSRRLSNISSPQGTAKTIFLYGGGANPWYNANRVTWAINDGYSWNYEFDILGRVTQQKLVTPFLNSDSTPVAAKATYAYNSDGQLAMTCQSQAMRQELQRFQVESIASRLVVPTVMYRDPHATSVGQDACGWPS